VASQPSSDTVDSSPFQGHGPLTHQVPVRPPAVVLYATSFLLQLRDALNWDSKLNMTEEQKWFYEHIRFTRPRYVVVFFFYFFLRLLWCFGLFWGNRLPFCGGFKADKILLFEAISPKLNLRPGRLGCLCPTPRSKPFRLGWAYCQRHSSLPTLLVSYDKNLLFSLLLLCCSITALLICIWKKLPIWICRKLTALTVAFLSLSRNVSG
jgi:hypothetical protein